MEIEGIIHPSVIGKKEIPVALAAMGIAYMRPDATYVAVPMTSGKRFLSWQASVGRTLSATSSEYRKRLAEHVVMPNIRRARSVIGRLRTSSPGLIEPTRFDAPRWTQDDYRCFWGRVIEKYVATAVFLDGWEYSSGCAYEFLVAATLKRRTLRQDSTALAGAEAVDRLVKAAEIVEKYDVSAEFLKTIAQMLKGR